MIEKVRFSAADGTRLIGDLHRPDDARGLLPGVVLIGPMTFCKEQAPTEYARRLAERGYAALAFDTRYRGESGGEPRCLEDPDAKVADIGSAVAYLAGRDDIDVDRIAALAICQGSSELLVAAADTPAIRVLASVAGHYRDHDGDIEWLTAAGLAKRLKTAEAAAAGYMETGEVDYVPAVDANRQDVGMPGDLVWKWYHVWADKGVWENRYAVMSDATLLPFESIAAARRLRTPWLMIHSDACMLPDAAKRHFEAAPARDKELVWEGETPHLAFYDQPDVIDPAIARIDTWFRRHLHVDQVRSPRPTGDRSRASR